MEQAEDVSEQIDPKSAAGDPETSGYLNDIDLVPPPDMAVDFVGHVCTPADVRTVTARQ